LVWVLLVGTGKQGRITTESASLLVLGQQGVAFARMGGANGLFIQSTLQYGIISRVPHVYLCDIWSGF
jgi:hypothetical protein